MQNPNLTLPDLICVQKTPKRRPKTSKRKTPKRKQIKEKTKVVLIGMGQKLELWSEKNWKLKEEGKNVKGERLEIELPSEVQEIPF